MRLVYISSSVYTGLDKHPNSGCLQGLDKMLNCMIFTLGICEKRKLMNSPNIWEEVRLSTIQACA